jgi:hypothetical protein
MSIKSLFLTAVLLAFFTAGFAQQSDTIRLFINGKLSGQSFVREEPKKAITVNKSKYTSVSSIRVGVNTSTARGGIFKRGLQISNSKDSVILWVKEAPTKPGWFIVPVTKAKEILKSNKDLNIYYTEDPRDPRLMVRSMRKLMVILHFE